MLASLFVAPAYATDYEITEPSFTSSLTLWSGDSLYMTAGEIGNLGMYGDSTAIIEGTSPSWLPEGSAIWCSNCYDIEQIDMYESSILTIFGGKIEKLNMNNNATVILELNIMGHVKNIAAKGNSSLNMSSGHVNRIEIGGIQGGVIIINPDPIVINYAESEAVLLPLIPIQPSLILI